MLEKLNVMEKPWRSIFAGQWESFPTELWVNENYFFLSAMMENNASNDSGLMQLHVLLTTTQTIENIEDSQHYAYGQVWLDAFAKGTKLGRGFTKLAKYLEYNKKTCQSLSRLPGVVKTYCMITWILSYKQELNGYGFPFDRTNLVYFQRMNEISKVLKDLPDNCEKLSELKFFLTSILTDPKSQKSRVDMEKKAHLDMRERTIRF